MRQLFGIVIILCMIPLLLGAQKGIATEWYAATAYKEKIDDSIVLTETTTSLPVTLLNEEGAIFSEVYVEWRDPLSLHQVPHFAQQLFLQSEDRSFYTHKGYDIAAIARAFARNSMSDDIQEGASTITQQLVRMKFLTTEKTYERKFKELLYAAELEKQFKKDEILEMYVNEMYFANGVYGLGGAATYYFNEPLHQLHEAEIAFLAAIPNNPSHYNPLRHFERTKARQELLLDVAARERVITEEEAITWKAHPIVLDVKEKVNRHPMFSDFVMVEMKELLFETLGYDEKVRKAKPHLQDEWLQQFEEEYSAIIDKGLIIETSLRESKQRSVEANFDRLLSSGEAQMGATVIDNDNREIVALYGGHQYEKAGFNRAFQAVRQPGSVIKPLLVYGPLLETTKYTAESMIDSSNICIGNYCPKNIGHYTYGYTSLSAAFRYSHNTAAVRALRKVGLEEAFNYLQPFRFEHITEDDHSYAAALGGFTKGMTPLEIARGYSSFVDGYYLHPSSIRTIRTLDGDVLYNRSLESELVWQQRTTNIMRQLLHDTVTNGTATAVRYSTTYTGAKTGTTNGYKDLWGAGLNDRYTAAVWLGFDRGGNAKAHSDAKTHLRALSSALAP